MSTVAQFFYHYLRILHHHVINTTIQGNLPMRISFRLFFCLQYLPQYLYPSLFPFSYFHSKFKHLSSDLIHISNSKCPATTTSLKPVVPSERRSKKWEPTPGTYLLFLFFFILFYFYYFFYQLEL